MNEPVFIAIDAPSLRERDRKVSEQVVMEELLAIEIAGIPGPHILAPTIILLAIDKRLALILLFEVSIVSTGHLSRAKGKENNRDREKSSCHVRFRPCWSAHRGCTCLA